ncbi:MAG: hypothetical protein FWF63_00865 [Fibromonadales bacterium]|nr:hypothetical protein [Fibromonadales bacterium]
MVLKFFLLAVAFFFISCNDIARDNPCDPDGINFNYSGCPYVQPSEGWDITGTVVLGGFSNASIGSFLDLDRVPFKVYMVGGISAAIDEIDIVFDGIRLFVVSYYDTPEGTGILGYDRLEGGKTALIWEYNGDKSPKKIAEFISSRIDANDYGYSNVILNAGKEYAVLTTEGWGALIVVNDFTNYSVTLSIGKIHMEF